MNEQDIRNAYKTCALNKEIIRRQVLADAAPEPTPERSPRKKPVWVGLATAAVILAVIVGIWIPHSVALRRAEAFFEQHNVSAAELTPNEMIAVYRDIETGSFKEDKTIEVINRMVEGRKITTPPNWLANRTVASPDDAKSAWTWLNTEQTYYRYDNVTTEKNGCLETLNESTLTKCFGDTEQWSRTIPYQMQGFTETENGVLIHGIQLDRGHQITVSFIDANGRLQWTTPLTDPETEQPLANVDTHLVKPLNDRIMVMCYDGAGTIIATELTPEGECMRGTKIAIPMSSHLIFIRNVARFNDEYLIAFSDHSNDSRHKLMRVAPDGTVDFAVTFSDHDTEYIIQDMVEWDGKVYLSTYAIPYRAPANVGDDAIGRPITVKPSEFREELVDLITHTDDAGEVLTRSDNELLPAALRDYYTAVLLTLDPETGRPTDFHEVDGGFGGRLMVGIDGSLVWDVEMIQHGTWFPAVNAWQVLIENKVQHLSLDASGTVIGQEMTDETTTLYR